MAWEKRRNGIRYYYRSYRDPITGRVRKEYIGTGPLAEEAARQDAQRRAANAERRRAEREAKREAERRFQEAHGLLLNLIHASDALTRAALARAGYYQHHRGEWRRYGKQKDNPTNDNRTNDDQTNDNRTNDSPTNDSPANDKAAQ